jgi:hypothetical protein
LIKHHSRIDLTDGESTFWHTFDPETKYLLLTGDSWNCVQLDTTKFISFEDCPASAPIPIVPPAQHRQRQPEEHQPRPLPFGPMLKPTVPLDQNHRIIPHAFSSDDSDSEMEFQSPQQSPVRRHSRKDIKISEDLSNRLLATERQTITREQARRRQRTPPPETPAQWPPATPQDDNQRQSCTQQ